jgi:serine/threonine protein phosphatase 1
MRTIVIGDIHNNFFALNDVITQINPVIEEDTLIFLGDYVDGWPDCSRTLSYLQSLDKIYNCIFIKGNHDVYAETFLSTGVCHPDWKNNGGYSTYDDLLGKFESNPEQRDIYLKFFKKLHLYYIDDNNNLFIHGGFDPERTLSKNKKFYGEEIFYWDRDLVNKLHNKDLSGIKTDEYIKKVKNSFNEIYVGHTTTQQYDSELKPLNFYNLWMVDTGAGWSGKLTAMDIDTKEIWQSNYGNIYYPNWKHL